MSSASNRRKYRKHILFGDLRVDIGYIMPVQCDNYMQTKFSVLKEYPIKRRIPLDQFVQHRPDGCCSLSGAEHPRRGRYGDFLRPCEFSQIGK